MRRHDALAVFSALMISLAAIASDDEEILSGFGSDLAKPGHASPQKAEVISSVQLSTCLRLKPGQSQIIHYGPHGKEASPTGVEAKYRLTRVNAKHYQVEINVNYLIRKTFKPSTQFREKVELCLKNYASALKGPKGQSLEIQLSQDPSIPSRIVILEKTGFRSHAGAYAQDAGCATIIHETMHLLGLVDEYREPILPYDELGPEKFSCRVMGPDDSIMHNQFLATAGSKREENYSREECVCLSGYDCRQLVKLYDGKSCPHGSYWRKTVQSEINSDEPEAAANRRRFILPAPPEKLVTSGYESYALYPAHFRAITEPGCRDVNAVYYTCASRAYLAVPSGKACPPLPMECVGTKFNWLR